MGTDEQAIADGRRRAGEGAALGAGGQQSGDCGAGRDAGAVRDE